MCLSVELIGNIWIGITGLALLLENNLNNSSRMLEITDKYPQCLTHEMFIRMYFYSYIIILNGVTFILITLLLVLLCILTRYLATRYLNHPFKRTLYKYIAWLVVQCIIIVICSNIYTVIFVYFIFPVFVL